jgi:PAS domain S-box-containing protein
LREPAPGTDDDRPWWRSACGGGRGGVIVVDRAGLIVFVNAQAERMFGYHRDELVGQPVETLVPDDLAAVHRRLRERYFDDARHRAMGDGQPLQARRRDGSDFPAEISLSCLHTDTDTIVSAAVRDISDRLAAEAEQARLRQESEQARMQERLQRTQRLESLGQLAGGIAHDFNNLIAVVANYAAFIVDTAQQHRDAEWVAIAHDARQIERAARRGGELTRQLLAFARKDVSRPRVLNVNDVITEVEDMLRRSIGAHITLTLTLADSIGLVLADAGQMEQVLVNLAVNARDAMPDGGTLAISTASVIVGPDYVTGGTRPEPGEYVRLRVSDTGTGMPPDVVERVFEPFYTTKAVGQGTGLGLAMVYGIVTGAGGTIDIYTEPGIGATITILLPTTDRCPAMVDTSVKPDDIRGHSETVLLVEDEPALAHICERILSASGYQVLNAGDPATAVNLAEHHGDRIDLLLTDVIMPQMLGPTLAARVTSIRPDTPVPYMSGYAAPVLTAQGTLPPRTSLLEKPFTRAELLIAIHHALCTRPPPNAERC